jgi:hypothetical protein
MEFNMTVKELTPAFMIAAVSVGIMMLLNFLLPMIPSVPLVNDAAAVANVMQNNLVGSIVYMFLTVFIAVIVKNMLQL